MDQQYQPLFNRTYLKILPWIVAIVIVLLTARSQNNSSDVYETLEDNWIYLSIDKALKQDQVKLVYPLSPAYSEQQAQQRIALQSSIGQALQTENNITAQWHDDKVILTVRLPAEKVSDDSFLLESMLDKVTTSAGGYYSQALQHAGAERYLALNTIDELALSNLKAQLLTPSMPITADTAHSLFSNRPTALLVFKEENDSLSKIISEQLKKHYPFTAQPRTSAPQLAAASRISLQHRGPSYLYLIGQAIPADSSNVSRSVALHYINQSLKEIADKNLSHYRLILQPSTPVGYAALSMTQNRPFQGNVISNLKTYLLQHLNNDKLEEIRSALATQYSRQLASPEKRADLLASQFFSVEKFQSIEEFRDTLASISTQQVQEHIQQLLDPEHAIIVTISPL
ncbi:insulinase family protein [Neptunomonas qingdaonensis]|uniref:Zinc protease n=1 Tax=Neptunomonas qingdaonensis TaxID=1045558 RepID=A0A1I2LTS6_9GAMM|nr:insulinase family protein [Neptunomonas qingdaonensis]SFF82762.1 hypothetical protein SAMN05216175_101253 [Neptunomonas qingdaonensis]